MSAAFTVACIQNCADDNVEGNIAIAAGLVREAAAAGAKLICLPENFTCLERNDQLYLEHALTEDEHPALSTFAALAAELGVWLDLGSLTIKTVPDKVSNRTFVIGPDGKVLGRYDKIHLFDVALKNGELYRESATVRPGECASLVDLPWGRLGLTICYDVRFPHLYRCLAQAGADFLAIPAAFTATTGEAHWHVLVRARAIENGCFVFAAGQCGQRPWGRRTYGHSLVVDPWGRVLADGGDDVGIILATIDPALVQEARAMIPSLSHDRPIRARP
ncbi:MAG: carbon-nitrogen hydrolase family protein [Gammaproteobacteria bacterium]|nr:carbon-nitrogen hydrolase family protein [Gammaproteobacteria bacterium]MBI5619006.1 carbon-nitrogen hydrolase family protein [Gammaproteobacteria bacterium]